MKKHLRNLDDKIIEAEDMPLMWETCVKYIAIIILIGYLIFG